MPGNHPELAKVGIPCPDDLIAVDLTFRRLHHGRMVALHAIGRRILEHLDAMPVRCIAEPKRPAQ
ncbi:hypothetical protein [Cupriavidus pinatubonensis]|uniref:hypothetical protein n=1 Tax=Cupriavidus pinatubonensis TaxID=248026 RepID=UPI0015E35747|nr:hypothetical protein [Cupriavidus pinatubonensis]